MINITERAKKALKKLLTATLDFPEGRLRLMDRGQGKLGLGVDIEMPGDVHVKYDGATVLVVDQRLAADMEGITLDAEDSEKGPELILDYN
jgi:Fe-S cluster assembly iron-binding protein IscA